MQTAQRVARAVQAANYLTALGWKVIRLSLTGTNPRHFDKYRLWERILQETDPRMPRFRINLQNARTTFVSMSRAKKKIGTNGEVKKDKSAERHDNPQRQFATDLSDALDQPVFTLFNQLMRTAGAALPDSKVTVG